MRVQQPGLIVLVVLLLGGLVWVLLRDDPPGTDGPRGRNEATTKAGDRTGRSPAALTGRDGKSDRSAVEAGKRRENIAGGPVFRVRGEVLRKKGTPLDGAQVVAYAGKPHDRRLSMAGMFSQLSQMGNEVQAGARFDKTFGKRIGEPLARADVQPDGSFEFASLSRPHVRLRLDHPYYGLDQPTLLHLQTGKDAYVLLKPYLGGQIVGRLPGVAPGGETGETEKTKETAAGSNIRLISEIDPIFMMQNPDSFMGSMMNSITRLAPLETGGRFEFRAVLPSNSIHLTYRTDTRAATHGPVAVTPGQTLEVVLRTVACGSVRAIVKDTAGLPVEKATVQIMPAEFRGQNFTAFSTLSAWTDASGVGTVKGISPGLYHARVRTAGFVAAQQDVAVLPDETKDITVTLDRGGSVRGKVVDGDGEPIADAGVMYLQNMKIPIIGDMADITGPDLLTKGALKSRQRTDADGEFVLSGLSDPDTFAVAAAHEDFTGGLARDVRMGDADVVVTLTRPASVIGKVVDDETEKPVANYSVAMLVKMAMIIERPSREANVTDSEDGAFGLKGVPPGRATLSIQAAGYAAYRKGMKTEPGTELDVGVIRLKKGGIIRGIVKSPEDKLLSGITVGRKVAGMMDNPLLQSMLGSLTCVTDKTGQFEMVDVPPGRIRLKATSPNHASGTSERMKIAAGQVVEGVEIILGSGGSIAGVLKLSEGMSTDGWMVTVSNNRGGSMRSELIGTDGTFRFDGIDPGKYDVQAMQIDWMRAMQKEKTDLFRPGEKMDIGKLIQAAQDGLVRTRCRVEEGEVTEVELDGTDFGEDGVELTIKVTLGDRPMPIGWIEVERIDGNDLTQTVVDNGIGRLASVQPGTYRLTIRTGITMTPVGDAVTIEVPVAKKHTVPVRLPGGSVHGKVIDEKNGEPLRDAVVRIVSAKGAETDQIEELGFAITDDKGRFRFEGLADGRYSLFVNDTFFARSDERHGGRLDGLRIEGGSKIDRVVMRARTAARASVRVADESDLPRGRAMVLAVDAKGKPLGTLPTYTDAKGMATLVGLPPGQVRIIALTKDRVPGFSEIQEIQTAGETRFDVGLMRGPRVWVRVEDKFGKEIRGVRLSARWKNSPWIPLSLVQRYDARAHKLDLGHLSPGPVEFRVHHRGSRPFVVNRVIPAGASAELVFTAPE